MYCVFYNLPLSADKDRSAMTLREGDGARLGVVLVSPSLGGGRPLG